MLEQQMEMEREYQTKFEFMARAMKKSEKATLEVRDSQAKLERTTKSIENSGKALLVAAKGKMTDQNADEIPAEILRLGKKVNNSFEKEILEIESIGRDTGGEEDKDD